MDDVDDINGTIIQRERDMSMDHAITECHSKSGPKRNCKRVFNRGLQAYVTLIDGRPKARCSKSYQPPVTTYVPKSHASLHTTGGERFFSAGSSGSICIGARLGIVPLLEEVRSF